jgi:gamma-glutamyltranspeptidase/glutathione hydrolase
MLLANSAFDRRRIIAVLLLIPMILLAAGSGYQNGVVASAHPLASQAGIEILQAGGNAVDAALATAFMLNVVEPNASGIGGGGYLVLKMAGETQPVFIDYRESAPMQSTTDMYYGESINFQQKTREGGTAVGVPGVVAGLLTLHERYGKLPLTQILQPAISRARNGFEISANLAGFIMEKYEQISANDAAATVFLKDLLPPEAGSIIQNPDLATTFNRIAGNGKEAFYSGEIAGAIAASVREQGGVMHVSDLAGYRPVVTAPVTGSYRGYEIISTAPSSGGGTHLIELLNIMEGYDLRKLGHNSAGYIHLLAEAMRIVLRDKAAYMCDPGFADVPVAELTGKDRAEHLRSLIRTDAVNFDYMPDLPPAQESESTTHLSVVDSERNIIALTQSINLWFGSAIMVDGTGILLNNHMNDFDSDPQSRNNLEPGKRPVSSIAPTLVLKDGKPILTIGTPGGSRIIGALAQIIINILDFDMPVEEAIDAPRIHSMEKTLYLEGRIGKDVADALTALGQNVKVRAEYDNYFGGAQGIYINPADGTLYGGADPRRDGVAAGY